MPKGANKKPDMLKPNEQPRDTVKVSDDLSAVDLGHDFVKAGEQVRVGRYQS